MKALKDIHADLTAQGVETGCYTVWLEHQCTYWQQCHQDKSLDYSELKDAVGKLIYAMKYLPDEALIAAIQRVEGLVEMQGSH